MEPINDKEGLFIRKNIVGTSYKQMLLIINKKFDKNYTKDQLKGYLARNNLKNNINSCFKKGHIPHNAGQKGLCAKGSEKGWFKKGNIPKNYRPLGSERLSKDGYIEIKVAESNKWKLKHRVVYENTNGPIPKGYAIIFKDQNKLNLDIDNLKLITRAELLRMNNNNLFSTNPELTETGVLIAKVIDASSKRKKGKTNEKEIYTQM